VIDAEKNRYYTDADKCTLKPRVKLEAHGEDGKGSPENGNQKECPAGTAHEQRCRVEEGVWNNATAVALELAHRCDKQSACNDDSRLNQRDHRDRAIVWFCLALVHGMCVATPNI